MKVIVMARVDGRMCNGWFAILITSIFFKGCYLLLLGLSNKELVIVRGVIPVHVFFNIFYRKYFFRTQGTRLGAIVAPNKSLQ